MILLSIIVDSGRSLLCSRVEVTHVALLRVTKYEYGLLDSAECRDNGCMSKSCDVTDLYAGLAERDAEAVGILAVVLDEFLQGSECGAARDEEPSFVKLPDAVMLHCVTVSHCRQTHSMSNSKYIRVFYCI